jgi:hypothetical protein
MHFSITDLPVPEPPMTTTDSPSAMSRVEAVEDVLAAERLVHAAHADFRTVARRRAAHQKNSSVRM